MQVLMNMDQDKMIIVLPTALIAMYLILRIQKSLCYKDNKKIGLILPAISFVVSTVLAVKPLFAPDAGQYDGLGMFCLRMWVTFNIVTLVFLVPYYKRWKENKEFGETVCCCQTEPEEEDSL